MLTETVVADNLKSLLDILDRAGPKSLVVDRNLNSLLAAVAPFSTLQSHGVEDVHWLGEELGPLGESDGGQNKSVVYLIHCDPKALELVTQHAAKCLGTNLQIVTAGGSQKLVEWYLESSEMLGDFEVHIWPAYFAEIGQNLSMFCNETGDRLVSATAEALVKLQAKYGTFARISGFGTRAKRIHELVLDGMGEQHAAAAETGGFNYEFGSTFVGNTIDHLVLVDRSVDWVTALLSQLTYQGLLDETYGIKSPGLIQRDNIKVVLGDDLFIQLADLNFGQVGAKLNATARNLQAEVDETHKAQSVAEIKDYVTQKLDGHRKVKQNLKSHTSLTEELMAKVKGPVFSDALSLQQDLVCNQLSTWDAILRLQGLIYQGCSVSDALRLASLLCICRNGVKEKQLHALYDEILKTFGYEYLDQILQLESEGLLFSSADGPAFTSLARTFKLNSEEPLSEPYAGYVPLSARLVQTLLSGGDTRPVSSFDTVRKSDDAREAKLRRVLLRNTPGRERLVVMVMFVGGVTYAEAAALRVLEQLHNVQIVVAATSMVRGKDVVGLQGV